MKIKYFLFVITVFLGLNLKAQKSDIESNEADAQNMTETSQSSTAINLNEEKLATQDMGQNISAEANEGEQETKKISRGPDLLEEFDEDDGYQPSENCEPSNNLEIGVECDNSDDLMIQAQELTLPPSIRRYDDIEGDGKMQNMERPII